VSTVFFDFQKIDLHRKHLKTSRICCQVGSQTSLPLSHGSRFQLISNYCMRQVTFLFSFSIGFQNCAERFVRLVRENRELST